MKETKQLQARRIAVEHAEGEVIETGKDLANLVLTMPATAATVHRFGRRITLIEARTIARRFLRRHKAAQKLRLEYTIDYVNESAKRIDAMIPKKAGDTGNWRG